MVELSIVMPCLNEAETVGVCVEKALRAMHDAGIQGEVIIADNGSTDGSREIAVQKGARVLDVAERGYGSALQAGIADARGEYILMGDSDDSYNFMQAPEFLQKLREGYDLVMGNRFSGEIRPGAMPPLHRYLGNPVLTFIGRMLFKAPSGDFHCGLRGFRRQSILGLNLRTTGMEFASEMVIKAKIMGLKITEIPTTLSPDGRSRPPHLRSWRDGWRHLRFMLLYSPRWLFLLPGVALILVGAVLSLWLLPGPRKFGSITFDVHTLIYAGAAIIVGYQAVLFAAFTKVFAMTEGLLPMDNRLLKITRYVTLESGLLVGVFILLAGLVLSFLSIRIWSETGFGPLMPVNMIRMIVPAVVCIVVGSQTILGSFFLSVLGLSRK
jgi:glycosyltransferase involved in cell wall biosynthesis